ncbi:hypothetical protein OURE66S_02221 [Oligella ureolytica]
MVYTREQAEKLQARLSADNASRPVIVILPCAMESRD